MSEQYIQSQFLLKQITNDFFQNRDASIVVKKYSRENNDYYISSSDDESDDESHSSQPSVQETYSYLDENKELQTIFDLCDGEIDLLKKYTVNVCAFQVQELNSMPYIQYLLVQESENYDFPRFEFQCSSNINVDEDEEMPPRHVYFQNEVFKHLLHYVEPLEDFQEKNKQFENVYQGFVQTTVQEKSIYVFMNIQHFQLKFGKFAMMDEIVNKHSILDIPIAPQVYQMFYQHNSFIHVKNQWGIQKDFPKVLYKCIYEDEKYVNVKSQLEDVISIIDDRIEHPILGNCYIFSCDKIEKNSDVLQRYLCFLDSPLYLMNPIDDFDEKESFTLGSVIPSIVDYSKSLMNNQEKVQEKDESNENIEATEEKVQEKEEEKVLTKKEQKEELMEMLDQNYDSVYFPIIQNGQTIYAWSIFNNDHFIQI